MAELLRWRSRSNRSTCRVARLAEQAQVGRPDGDPLHRRLNCDRLSVQLKLAATLASGVPFVRGNVTLRDGPAEIIPKVFDHAIQAWRAAATSCSRRCCSRQ
ncbi:MAG: hypothetical protein U1F63_05585 [Chitinivorax sp.]